MLLQNISEIGPVVLKILKKKSFECFTMYWYDGHLQMIVLAILVQPSYRYYI